MGHGRRAAKHGISRHHSGIPTFYIVGKSGRIAYVGVGFDPGAEAKLGDIIRAELAKPGAAPNKE